MTTEKERHGFLHFPPDCMMRRRDFASFAGAGLIGALGTPAGAATQAGAATPSSAPSAGAPRTRWSNWSGLEQCDPRHVLQPAAEAQLADALRTASGPIRFVGAGHSFTALVPTPATLVMMDGLSGIVRHDAAARTAVVRAGTRIAILAPELDSRGLALPNQPDISVQSLAGSFATGTHGTGTRLPALHAQILSLRLATADGRVLVASRDRSPDLFHAARVGLGSLGALTEVELQVQPRFHLRRRVWTQRTEEMLASAPKLAKEHRHFEFFVLPHTGYAAGVAHDEVPAAPAQRVESDDEDTLTDLRRLRDMLGRFPSLRRWVAGRFIGEREEVSVDVSWRLLSNTRATRFNESEYHLPAEQGLPCLRAVLAAIEKHPEAYFPVEFRHVAADDAWLSPFHGRDSCSVAVHAAAGEDHGYLVKELGPIFRRHGGRPHWGKLHDMAPAELAAAYPRWKDFHALRRELDPQGRLLNPYLRRLFGEEPRA
jgi:FAD-linked oxidoreductase